jgi:hypothetical protein
MLFQARFLLARGGTSQVFHSISNGRDQDVALLPRSYPQRKTLLHDTFLDGQITKYWSTHQSKAGVVIRTLYVRDSVSAIVLGMYAGNPIIRVLISRSISLGMLPTCSNTVGSKNTEHQRIEY